MSKMFYFALSTSFVILSLQTTKLERCDAIKANSF